MRYDIQQFKSSFNLYTELRFQENRNILISSTDGVITENSQRAESGVSARCGYKNRFGFSSSSCLDDEIIKNVLREANDNAKFLGGKSHDKDINYYDCNENIERLFITKKNRYSRTEMIDFLKAVDNYIVATYPNLKSRTLRLWSLDMEKMLLTSSGAYAHTMVPRTMMYVILRSESSDGPITNMQLFGGRGQVEDVFDDPKKLYSKIDKAYKELMDKKDAVYAKAGTCEVVMDSDLAGILAHEAIGHTTEADLVLGGSVAGDNLNKKVASDLVTLVDFANLALNQEVPIPVFIDDEGVQAKDAVIIENGVLKSFMHNKESANHFGITPTGNARAYEYFDEPLIRMRNTCIIPGKSKLNEMIATVEKGYYLVKSSNGQADSTSEFMFGVPLGYEIINGKLGRAIRETTISGVAFDVLKTVTMISDEITWSGGGMCGKKQMIPVGMGGPAIKCQVNIGGKA
ncbi:MAG: peptidase [Bdellovibrionales bacterium RIFOXYA1_FULL_36_14]|nr:MAG: peptidase [Bdellovibrionales bacterium RIFOXYA1_FULL_36_14]